LITASPFLGDVLFCKALVPFYAVGVATTIPGTAFLAFLRVEGKSVENTLLLLLFF
jgi:hypothetical protein